jgi:hypothetical protein
LILSGLKNNRFRCSTSAPILRYFDFSKPAIVEPDASDFALGTILSQYDDDGVLHPVAFHSRQLTSAKINYDTFDKELLGIVQSFKVWRHYLIAANEEYPTRVINDHANLQHFLSKQQLSRDEGHDFRSKSKFYNVYGICLQSIVSYLSDCMILQVVMDHGLLPGAHILILWTVEYLHGHVYVYSAPEQELVI